MTSFGKSGQTQFSHSKLSGAKGGVQSARRSADEVKFNEQAFIALTRHILGTVAVKNERQGHIT